MTTPKLLGVIESQQDADNFREQIDMLHNWYSVYLMLTNATYSISAAGTGASTTQ